MTTSAPAAMALTMSPLYLMPPSAMIGTPCLRAARAQSKMAVICGMPAPEMTRVVQIEPAPTPTLIASAPASISASRALGGHHIAGDDRQVRPAAADALDGVHHPGEWPWAVSIATTSTPSSTSSSRRVSRSAPTPTAAPTSRRPWASVAALGNRAPSGCP